MSTHEDTSPTTPAGTRVREAARTARVGTLTGQTRRGRGNMLQHLVQMDTGDAVWCTYLQILPPEETS